MRKKLLFVAVVLSVGVGILASCALNTRACAQTAPTADTPHPSFEVSSIKPNHSGSGGSHFDFSISRLVATNVAVKSLILLAYNIRPSQLSGAPSWVDTARFDINAKVDDALVDQMKKMKPEETGEQSNLLLQSLLAERFNLKVSHATKELPIYALVVAKGGPKIQESRPEQRGSGTNVSSRGGGPVQMEAKGLTMAMFAQSLSRQVDRTVLDRTGLAGRYDFTLQWSRDEGQGAIFKATDNASAAASTPPPDSSSPTIFTAIREQLGLKLESTKGPVDILVIEHVELPSPD